MSIRVHFARAQVQLPLDQNSSKARVYRLICIAPLVDRSKAQVLQGELAGEARLRGSCIAPLADRSK